MMTETELSKLVDPETIRRSIKRIFTNTPNEIFGELLQNSQRACAGRVYITTHIDPEDPAKTGFTFRDNGHGLNKGAESFHTLLAMAKSYFDNSTIEAQDPMGLGIHALLSHDKVTEIRFTSDTQSLHIDTYRWWNEPAYYSTWYERLTTVPRVEGFEIEVVCHVDLVKGIDEMLRGYSTGDEVSCLAGYKDVMKIYVNDKEATTSIPISMLPVKALLTTEYMGCEVRLGTSTRSSLDKSSVNWYGQVIPVSMYGFKDTGTMRFHIRVFKNHPFNPMSPSRRGIIMDDAMHEFVQWCKDKIFNWVLDPEHKERQTLENVVQLFDIDNKRASAELDVFPAYMLNKMSDYAYSDGDATQHPHDTHMVLLSYSGPEIVCDGSVYVIEDDNSYGEQAECGLMTFLDHVDFPVYQQALGDHSRKSLHRATWRPGPPSGREKYPNAKPDMLEGFFKPGDFGFVSVSDTRQEYNLQPLPNDAVVCTFDGLMSYDPMDCGWKVGAEDPLDFLADTVDLGRDPEGSDEDSSSVCEEVWNENTASWRRGIVGNALDPEFKLADLQRLTEAGDRVLKVEYNWVDGNTFAPKSVTIHFEKAEPKTRDLVG